MKIDYKNVEVVKTEKAIVLTLTIEEAQIILASLGKAKTDDVAEFVRHSFKDSTAEAYSLSYKLYNDLYDEMIPKF